MLDATALVLLVLLAPAKTRPEVPAPVADTVPVFERIPSNGVRLFESNDPDYLSLGIPGDRRIAPQAGSRLVVFRDGAPVLDRGLRVEKWLAEADGASKPPVEEGAADDAVVAPDGRFAVLASTRFRRVASPPGRPSEAPGKARGVTELVWIDPAHPEGRWTTPLENGRWIQTIVPLSPVRGVAVSTLADPDDPDADFRIYGPDGKESMRIPETEGVTAEIASASHGGFVAVDLLFPDRIGLPNRGVTVLDLTYGTRWTYTWTYGSDGEPTSWRLDDMGILEVTTPESVRSFDRNGKPIRLGKRR